MLCDFVVIFVFPSLHYVYNLQHVCHTVREIYSVLVILTGIS